MTIRQRVKIQPGGTVEIRNPDLPAGVEAEVVVTVAGPAEMPLLGEFEPDPAARPFWEQVIEIGARVPPEEWEKVPTDLSINLDHYLYGSPKQKE
jgi:hypothetical protein